MTTLTEVATIRNLCQDIEDIDAAIACVYNGSSYLVTTRYLPRDITNTKRKSVNETHIYLPRDIALGVLMETRRFTVRRLEDFGVYLDPDQNGRDLT